jgi:hypothetical protein
MSEVRKSVAIGDAVQIEKDGDRHNGEVGVVTKAGLFPTLEGEDGTSFGTYHISTLKAAAMPDWLKDKIAKGKDKKKDDDDDDEADDGKKKKRAFPGAAPPFGSKERSAAAGDDTPFDIGDEVVVKSTGEYGTVVSDEDGEYKVEDDDDEDLGTFSASQLKAATEADRPLVEDPQVEDLPAPKTLKERLRASVQTLVATLTGASTEDSADLIDETVETVQRSALTTALDQAVASLAEAQDLASSEIISDGETAEAPEATSMRMAGLATLTSTIINNLYTATNIAQSCIADERFALGARHSSFDLKTIQAVHDNSVALGATCPGAEARSAEARSASAHDEKEENTMTREERITALIAGTAGKPEPYTEADGAWLKTLSDGRFTALEAAAAVTRGSSEEEILAGVPEELRTLVAKGREAVAAEATPLTEEAYLKNAPESIRTLVVEKKAADASLKTELITTLKGVQSEFTEPELQKMNLPEIIRLARALRVNEPAPVDFGALGIPRSAAAGDEVFSNPPDGYALALAKKTA